MSPKWLVSSWVSTTGATFPLISPLCYPFTQGVQVSSPLPFPVSFFLLRLILWMTDSPKHPSSLCTQVHVNFCCRFLILIKVYFFTFNFPGDFTVFSTCVFGTTFLFPPFWSSSVRRLTSIDFQIMNEWCCIF